MWKVLNNSKLYKYKTKKIDHWWTVPDLFILAARRDGMHVSMHITDDVCTLLLLKR